MDMKVHATVSIDDLATDISEAQLVEFIRSCSYNRLAKLWPIITKELLGQCYTYCPHCHQWYKDGTLVKRDEEQYCPVCNEWLIDTTGEEVFRPLSFEEWKGGN
jgi:antirestriction protein